MVADSQSILMVDDEFDIVECIKLWLQRLELDASGFTDLLLAIEYFKNNCNNTSLVLTDIRMPQTNGYELVKKIRNLEAEVRIILISAFEINHLEKEICQKQSTSI
ncbi:MAG: response regulator [Nitrososphaeraceae archaeon]